MNNHRLGTACTLCFLVAAVITSCSTQRKLNVLRSESLSASLETANIDKPVELEYDPLKRDTIIVSDGNGGEITIMKAVKNENGELVANDVIDAATVTARFKNVAERHGKVDLVFQISVPKLMQDARWQIRLNPMLTVLNENVRLDSIMITGAEYRKSQIMGYNRYDRFLKSIVTDSSAFVNRKELGIFLDRNSSTGWVKEAEALEFYTNQLKVKMNDRRIAKKDRMFSKYVKVPIVTEGLRLDTVMTSVNGDFIYEYSQTVNARPLMKSASVTLEGGIYQEDIQLYSIPETEPVVYYISSLSSFVDDREKYLTQVIDRMVHTNSVCWIDFEQGSSIVLPDFGNNSAEIDRIRRNFSDLMGDGEFEMDSIIVTASCSPEGRYEYNRTLSMNRSKSVSSYFRTIGDGADAIRFISRSEPENWDMLLPLVKSDTLLTPPQKASVESLFAEQDPDVREDALAGLDCYTYLREKMYPRLRTVKFDFHMHRKWMEKDTIHTTVIDTAYMRGVQAIKDRDYRTAVSILRPYADFNAAVAFCAMDYNLSAMNILQSLEKNDRTEYMKAILYARDGKDKEAIEHYMSACKMNPAFVHRGNLDPEISILIKMYNLNKTEQL